MREQAEDAWPAVNLSVLGEIFLIMMLALMVMTFVNQAVLRGAPLSRSAQTLGPKEIAVEVSIGPGRTVQIDGAPVMVEELVEGIRKSLGGPQEGNVLVRAHPGVEATFYWEVRLDMTEAGLTFIEGKPKPEAP